MHSDNHHRPPVTHIEGDAMTRKLLTAALVGGLLLFAAAADRLSAGEPLTSDLLLPYFEVELDNPSGLTTLFAVGNAWEEPVSVRIDVFSNWGIPVIEASADLDPDQVLTVNLRDWFVAGRLPNRSLNAAELAHLEAALTGQRSPEDDLYYSTEVALRRAVGYVTVRIQGAPRRNALFGDWFVVDPGQDFARGSLLVDISPTASCGGLCLRHALRFMVGGAFSGGTQFVIWTPRQGQPSTDPLFPASSRVGAVSAAYDEAGRHMGSQSLDLLPLQMVDAGELGLTGPFGWLDLEVEMDSFITVRHSAENRFSVGLETFCLPPDEPEGPEIEVEKYTNGHDADAAPGPSIPVGDPVQWEYVVTNTGNVALDSVEVTDDQGVAVSCPGDSLSPGESMTCTGSGLAEACQYGNLGSVVGYAADGTQVSDSDPSHYFGEAPAAIDVEKATDGHDADAAPGPALGIGDPVYWTYVVTNTGEVPLSGVSVSDDQGVAVSCPATELAPGAAMTCTGSGFAVLGQYANLGTAVATSTCGTGVSDSDPSHYYGEPAGGDQGCTPGYWKNHTDSWPPTGYAPGQSIAGVFSAAAAYPAIGSASLLDGLNFGGGPGVEGAARNLLRAGIAALLNASHSGVAYPRSPDQVIGDVDAALASGDRATMLSLAAALDGDNNLGCPLN